MLRAVFVQMAGNSVVDVPRCEQAGTSCTFDGFRDDGDRGESWFRLVESEGDGNDGRDWLGEETDDGGAWWKKMTRLLAELLRAKASMFQLTSNIRLCRGIVGTNVQASSRVKHCESAVGRTSTQERCVQNVGKNNNNTLKRPSKIKKEILTFTIAASCVTGWACKNFDEAALAQQGTHVQTADGAGHFQTAREP